MRQTINLKEVIALIAADIDTFLLMDETQEQDNDKPNFTHEEIREQLTETCKKMMKGFTQLGFDIDKPLTDITTNN